MNITILCDCWGLSTPSLVPDIGILASKNITAIEKASFDMVKTKNLVLRTLPEDRELVKGNHLFKRIWDKDP